MRYDYVNFIILSSPLCYFHFQAVNRKNQPELPRSDMLSLSVNKGVTIVSQINLIYINFSVKDK